MGAGASIENPNLAYQVRIFFSPHEKIRWIINKMLRSPMLPDVQEDGCEDLSKIATNAFQGEEFILRIVKEGGLDLVMGLFMSFADNELVIKAATQCLKVLAQECTTADLIRQKGGIPLLDAAMASLHDDKALNADAQEALGLIEKHSVDIAKRQVEHAKDYRNLFDIVALMHVHMERAALQLYACDALWELTQDLKNVEKLRKAECDGALAIVNVFNYHDSDPQIIGKACAIVRNSAKDKLFSVLLGRRGVITGLLTALRTFPNDPYVTQMAFWALDQLTWQKSNIHRLLQLRGKLVLATAEKLIRSEESPIKSTFVTPRRLEVIMSGKMPWNFSHGDQEEREVVEQESSDSDSLADWDD